MESDWRASFDCIIIIIVIDYGISIITHVNRVCNWYNFMNNYDFSNVVIKNNYFYCDVIV